MAGDLPERDAMSIIGVGGLEGGLPPAGLALVMFLALAALAAFAARATGDVNARAAGAG